MIKIVSPFWVHRHDASERIVDRGWTLLPGHRRYNGHGRSLEDILENRILPVDLSVIVHHENKVYIRREIIRAIDPPNLIAVNRSGVRGRQKIQIIGSRWSASNDNYRLRFVASRMLEGQIISFFD